MGIEYIKIYDWMLYKFRKVSVMLIYALIYQYHEASLECAMSYSELAAELKMSKPSIIDAVKELERDGLIEVERGFEKDGGNSINIYKIISE